ncbi:peptide deformylase, partial [Methanocorpusculaceae archaeon]|nr:peptide deformylase [Methanocorpusculaceae archaeon]
MIQQIRKYGDPCLTAVCETVAEIGDEERRILDDMEDTMREYHCVGLSAPQIGVCRRLFIVAVGGVFIRGANPEVVSAGALAEDIEGSPCIPGIQRPVRRPKKILCRYLDESGET